MLPTLNAANGVHRRERVQFIEHHRVHQLTGSSTRGHTQKGLLKQEDSPFNTDNPTCQQTLQIMEAPRKTVSPHASKALLGVMEAQRCRCGPMCS